MPWIGNDWVEKIRREQLEEFEKWEEGEAARAEKRINPKNAGYIDEITEVAEVDWRAEARRLGAMQAERLRQQEEQRQRQIAELQNDFIRPAVIKTGVMTAAQVNNFRMPLQLSKQAPPPVVTGLWTWKIELLWPPTGNKQIQYVVARSAFSACRLCDPIVQAGYEITGCERGEVVMAIEEELADRASDRLVDV